jgi:hypothetical protein
VRSGHTSVSSFYYTLAIMVMLHITILISAHLAWLVFAAHGLEITLGIPPNHQDQQTDHAIPGVKRVKIRSGPYTVPNMSKRSWVSGEHGLLWNMPVFNIQKPCKDSCTILRQWAGLEYANGTNANIDSGMWLHHMVHLTSGPTRWDPVCYGRLSLPHAAIFHTAGNSERYFSSGNERSMMDFNPGGKDLSYGTGYYLTAADSFYYLVDLMNMNMDDRDVYVTMTYDYLPGEIPPNWEQIKTVWLDVSSCILSEVKPHSETGAYQIGSEPWTPNLEGRVIGMLGHLHDGKFFNSSELVSSE